MGNSPLWKVLSVTEMQAVEREANASGLTFADMMQNAGRNLAEVVHARAGKSSLSQKVLALVGPGNNGGDALVALDFLARWGWQVSAYLLRPRNSDPLLEKVREAGGSVAILDEDHEYARLQSEIIKANVILDGVLGTGTRLPLRDDVARLLSQVSDFLSTCAVLPMIIAVDCPSGVDCDSGDCAPETLNCGLTVTMAAVKQGLLYFPAAGKTGELQVVEIGPLGGLHAWEKIDSVLVNRAMVREKLPARPQNAHKGTFGTALVCAGSISYSGAAWLAGQAAYRAGAGLVTLAVPEPLHVVLAGQFPEATWVLLPQEEGYFSKAGVSRLVENASKASALLLGPGWGQQAGTRDFLEALLANALPPLVLDADALKLLATISNWPDLIRQPAVLTPHPGEMAILTGEPKDAQTFRIDYARTYAEKWGHVVVLKGAYTVVASPDSRTAVIPFATPALARAGTGDVLAGLIVGLRAQGMPAFDAAWCGAWLHGYAGALAARQNDQNTASILAGDVLSAIRLAIPAT